MLEEIGGYENELTAVPAKAVKEMIKVMERQEILLKATHDILKKCEEGPYVKDVFEQTAVWDDVDCDAGCLMEEISCLLEDSE